MIREVEAFKALGGEIRLRIVRVLRHAGRELCVCELVDILSCPQYSVSRNLNILKKAGLVIERRDGRMIMYRLINDSGFNRALFEAAGAVTSNADPLLYNDFKRLEKRLKMRVNGEVVVTSGGGFKE